MSVGPQPPELAAGEEGACRLPGCEWERAGISKALFSLAVTSDDSASKSQNHWNSTRVAADAKISTGAHQFKKVFKTHSERLDSE